MDKTDFVIIIDMNNPMNCIEKIITADLVIMNPTSKIIATKVGKTFQILNIESNTQIKMYNIIEGCIFWKWINMNIIGIVIETSVYHWTMENENYPVKIFDRHQYLQDFQIINYRTDESLQ